MEITKLREFVALCEIKNFARTALHLHVSAPALTRHIQQLEAELKVVLVERSSTKVIVTKAGIQFYNYALHLLSEVKDIKARMLQIGKVEQRSIKIGFTPGVLDNRLSVCLPLYNSRHKLVEVQLQEMDFRNQEAALRSHQIDIALVGLSQPELIAEFDLFQLGNVPLSAVLPQNHSLATSTVDLRALKGDNFVGLSEHCNPGRNLCMIQACGEAGFQPTFTGHAVGKAALMIMVAATGSVSLYPSLEDNERHSGVVFQKLVQPCLIPYCAAVRRSESRPHVRDFLEGLRNQSMGSKHHAA